MLSCLKRSLTVGVVSPRKDSVGVRRIVLNKYEHMVRISAGLQDIFFETFSVSSDEFENVICEKVKVVSFQILT
jgi:hypothetical protein